MALKTQNNPSWWGGFIRVLQPTATGIVVVYNMKNALLSNGTI